MVSSGSTVTLDEGDYLQSLFFVLFISNVFLAQKLNTNAV